MQVYAHTAGWEDVDIRFLCGADLLESFSVPNLWAKEHVSMWRPSFVHNDGVH